MNSRKRIALVLIAALAFTSFAACSKDKVAKESTTAGQSSSTIIGKVTEINGTTITLALGEMPGRGMRGDNGKDGGAMPSGAPDGNGKNDGFGKDRGTMPSGAPDGNGKDGGPGTDSGAIPSGAPDGNGKDGGPSTDGGAMPSGTPNGDGKGGGRQHGGMNAFFKETGETKTIDVTDESLIKLRSADGETTGSLKDITVDSILTVQYEEDGTTISAIIVQGNSDNATAPDNQDKSSF